MVGITCSCSRRTSRLSESAQASSIAYTEGSTTSRGSTRRCSKRTPAAHRHLRVPGGEIRALMKDDRKKARELAELYAGVFGRDRFFIELQKHIPEQDQINPHLIDLADRLGLGCVATNDVHFLLENDHAPHDCLCCISTGKLVSDAARMRYPTQLYMKSTAEMYAAMSHPKWFEACENSHRIAEMCQVELPSGQSFAPVVKIERADRRGRLSDHATGSTAWYQDFCAQFELLPFDELNDRNITADELKLRGDEALRELAEAGAVWRYGEHGITPEIRARLDRELKILADKTISAYFLIVWDFCNEARRRGIPVNARGSASGPWSVMSWASPTHAPSAMVCCSSGSPTPTAPSTPTSTSTSVRTADRRSSSTSGRSMDTSPRSSRSERSRPRAIRDVGRVHDIPLDEVDKVCKLVGEALG
ncbi:MAG: hypothetical protein HC888_17975 [Candidatus Competibacteraceae bacterium]|nr:hypothetical protein [Candidatus Competibacteraceae bacterium]